MKISIEMDTAQPMRSDQVEALVALVRTFGGASVGLVTAANDVASATQEMRAILDRPVTLVPAGPVEFVTGSGQTGVMDDAPPIDIASIFSTNTAAALDKVVSVTKMGDYYEVIDPDAASVAEILDLTLTESRSGVPMVGWPYHAHEQMLAKLAENCVKTTPGIVDTSAASPDGQTGVVMPEKDSQGVVWDPRIHASTKTQTKVGQWTRRKGVDDAVFAQVMGELTAAAIGAPLADLTPVTPAAPPPPPAASGPMTFPEFMMKVTAKGIPAATIIAECQKVGVASVPLLGTARPDLIPTVAAALGVV